MKSSVLLMAALVALVAPPALLAQGVDVTRARVHTILTAASDTPGGQGLLPTALAEAHIAVEHAARARRAGDDLAAIQEHARGVIHAIDPMRIGSGPGLGYGLRRAVVQVGQELDLARAADGRADVATAAPRALAAAGHVLGWATALVDLAERIQAATSASDAHALAVEMVALSRRLAAGVDVDRDGHVTFAPGEAGLYLLRLSVSLVAQGRDAMAAAEGRVP